MSGAVFRLVGSRSGAWKVVIEQPKLVASTIGTSVLAAFYKCFVTVDRITSIENLMILNHQHSPKIAGGRSVAEDRNANFLMLMMAGTMYELGNALHDLQQTRVVTRLRDSSTWAPLNELRKFWLNAPLANTLRNGFAFHLGDVAAYEKGIASSSDVVTFQEGHGLGRGTDRFVAPLDALLSGEGMQDDSLKDYLQRMSRDHLKLRTLMFDFFEAVLVENGIPYVDETTE